MKTFIPVANCRAYWWNTKCELEAKTYVNLSLVSTIGFNRGENLWLRRGHWSCEIDKARKTYKDVLEFIDSKNPRRFIEAHDIRDKQYMKKYINISDVCFVKVRNAPEYQAVFIEAFSETDYPMPCLMSADNAAIFLHQLADIGFVKTADGLLVNKYQVVAECELGEKLIVRNAMSFGKQTDELCWENHLNQTFSASEIFECNNGDVLWLGGMDEIMVSESKSNSALIMNRRYVLVNASAQDSPFDWIDDAPLPVNLMMQNYTGLPTPREKINFFNTDCVIGSACTIPEQFIPIITPSDPDTSTHYLSTQRLFALRPANGRMWQCRPATMMNIYDVRANHLPSTIADAI